MLLTAEHLVKRYPHRTGSFKRVAGWLTAVDDVSLEIHPGETVGLVGESGSGKTTLARLLAGLIAPTAGEVRFHGRSLSMIFQSPLLSLDPRMRVADLIAEPLVIRKVARGSALRTQVTELVEEVGLDAGLAARRPHELSGGQRQRVAIARALALRPELILCDEPVASLDVTIQRQILELLLRLQARHRMAYLFISHHLGVVGAVAHRILVMHQGRIVETGDNPALFHHPQHPYTQTLLASVIPPKA